MIPLEYENLKTWIRIHNRILVNMGRRTPDPEIWNKGYIAGARYMVKMLSQQWAHDIIARRKHEANRG